jgi:hypothetical protein
LADTLTRLGAPGEVRTWLNENRIAAPDERRRR